jgi:hypothetical protein
MKMMTVTGCKIYRQRKSGLKMKACYKIFWKMKTCMRMKACCRIWLMTMTGKRRKVYCKNGKKRTCKMTCRR